MTSTHSTTGRGSGGTAHKDRRSAALDDRLGRFYLAWRSQANSILVRAFGSQLDEHAREDAYSTAWAASLSSLGQRIGGMTDAELRKYIFSAVTTHAGKELRRRGRKPVDPLGDTDPVGDFEDGPAEAVVKREDQRVLRDVLAGLPDRRRRVLTLRYAVGLTPEEICELVEGLSIRGYRKEITRGIKELATSLALIESGEWCSSLAGEIEAFASGQASGREQERARAHLAHCASCSKAVRRLASSLHDLSMLPAIGLLAGASPAGASMVESAGGMIERVKGSVGSVLGRGGDGDTFAASVASSGGTRGGGSALLAGIGAKVGALGVAGKVAVGCLGASAGLATCVATGVVPASAVNDLLPDKPAEERPQEDDSTVVANHTVDEPSESAPAPDAPVKIPEGNSGEMNSPDPKPDTSIASAPETANESPTPEPVIAPETVTPIEAESTPEVAAATADGGASGGQSRSAPQQADADQASAQLGTP